jgi:hypothetical protein
MTKRQRGRRGSKMTNQSCRKRLSPARSSSAAHRLPAALLQMRLPPKQEARRARAVVGSGQCLRTGRAPQAALHMQNLRVRVWREWKWSLDVGAHALPKARLQSCTAAQHVRAGANLQRWCVVHLPRALRWRRTTQLRTEFGSGKTQRKHHKWRWVLATTTSSRAEQWYFSKERWSSQ